MRVWMIPLSADEDVDVEDVKITGRGESVDYGDE